MVIRDIVLQSEDIWFIAPRKGVLVFALLGERCVADISDDFKILFSNRHGDFYWCVRGPCALQILLDCLQVGCKWALKRYGCHCRWCYFHILGMWSCG